MPRPSAALARVAPRPQTSKRGGLVELRPVLLVVVLVELRGPVVLLVELRRLVLLVVVLVELRGLGGLLVELRPVLWRGGLLPGNKTPLDPRSAALRPVLLEGGLLPGNKTHLDPHALDRCLVGSLRGERRPAHARRPFDVQGERGHVLALPL